MSYERDHDHVTRGVGAIAAADHVASGRHRRRVAIGQATRRRDQTMAAISRGALSGLYARSSANKIIDEPMNLKPVKVVGAPPQMPPPPQRPPAPSGPQQTNFFPPPPMRPLPVVSVIVEPPPPPKPPIGPVGLPVLLPTSMVPTAPGTMLIPIAQPTSTVSAGKTGATTSAGSSIVKPMPSIDLIAMPTTTMPDAGDNAVRNLAIAGGVALAAYFLFFRERR